jgi:hypothetical protein
MAFLVDTLAAWKMAAHAAREGAGGGDSTRRTRRCLFPSKQAPCVRPAGETAARQTGISGRISGVSFVDITDAYLPKSEQRRVPTGQRVRRWPPPPEPGCHLKHACCAPPCVRVCQSKCVSARKSPQSRPMASAPNRRKQAHIYGRAPLQRRACAQREPHGRPRPPLSAGCLHRGNVHARAPQLGRASLLDSPGV